MRASKEPSFGTRSETASSTESGLNASAKISAPPFETFITRHLMRSLATCRKAGHAVGQRRCNSVFGATGLRSGRILLDKAGIRIKPHQDRGPAGEHVGVRLPGRREAPCGATAVASRKSIQHAGTLGGQHVHCETLMERS